MKKVFFTAFVAAAFAFGMTACNNNAAEQVADSTADTVEVCEHQCAHECACADSTCAERNCEACPNKGTENCCKVKNGEQCQGNHECCKGANEGCKGNHEGCEGNHEGCKHQCQHNK